MSLVETCTVHGCRMEYLKIFDPSPFEQFKYAHYSSTIFGRAVPQMLSNMQGAAVAKPCKTCLFGTLRAKTELLRTENVT